MSNFWKDISEPWRVAFPIAEVYENGDAVITKPAGSGRMVTEWTVKEHLVYEIHDPARYLMADGISDLTNATVRAVGPDSRSRVRLPRHATAGYPEALPGVRGRVDWRVGNQRLLARRVRKGAVLERFLRGRFEALRLPVREMRIDFIGLNSIHGPLAPLPANLDEINEVRVRVAVRTTTKEWANLVRREVTHLWTHGPVGTTAVISPPPPRQVISLWPRSSRARPSRSAS